MSFYFIVTYSQYHHAVFGRFSNYITGNINTRYTDVQQYFYLRKTNDSLVKANEALYNKLKQDYAIPDTVTREIIDTMRLDSLVQYKKITYLSARVVSNAVTSQSNFIVLSRGRDLGVKEGMGVVDVNNDVVGIVTDVDDKYAVVMSMLHKDSHISGKLEKSGETGTLNWNGEQPNVVTLTGIPKSAKVVKGDKVISSGFSTAFPKGLSIGKVQAIFKETRSNYFSIRIQTAADFHSLQYVYVIDNADREGANNMLEKTKQKH